MIVELLYNSGSDWVHKIFINQSKETYRSQHAHGNWRSFFNRKMQYSPNVLSFTVCWMHFLQDSCKEQHLGCWAAVFLLWKCYLGPFSLLWWLAVFISDSQEKEGFFLAGYSLDFCNVFSWIVGFSECCIDYSVSW